MLFPSEKLEVTPTLWGHHSTQGRLLPRRDRTAFVPDNLPIPPPTFALPLSFDGGLCCSCCEPWHPAFILSRCSCPAAAGTAAN